MFKHTILLPTGTIYSVDWYNDLIVTGSGDNGIRVVDASTEKIVWKHDEAHKGDVNCVRWSPDGMCISNSFHQTYHITTTTTTIRYNACKCRG